MNRCRIVAVGTCATLLWVSAASALGGVGPAGATVPATRGTMVQVTPTLPPPTPRVLLIGDSSLEGMEAIPRSQVALRGMTYVLDGISCRRLIVTSCQARASGRVPNTAVEAIQAAPGSFDAVVIGTGYNEGSVGFAQGFDLVVSAARAKGAVRILWMNYRPRDALTKTGIDNNPAYIANNATLLQLVASGAYPDVFIADWRTYTEPVRSWFVYDGIHYQTGGAYGAADYISRWIAFLFHEPCPMPTTVGGPIADPCTSPDGMTPPDVLTLYAA